MKKLLFSILGITCCILAYSQTTVSCKNKLDTAKVIAIAKRHNAYWIKLWFAPPSIKFNEDSCTWTVVSYKSKHTNRGECKHTNGCTLTKTVTLIINAKTRRVISKRKKKEMFPNYE